MQRSGHLQCASPLTFDPADLLERWRLFAYLLEVGTFDPLSLSVSYLRDSWRIGREGNLKLAGWSRGLLCMIPEVGACSVLVDIFCVVSRCVLFLSADHCSGVPGDCL